MNLTKYLLTLAVLIAVTGCSTLTKSEEQLDYERTEEQIYRDARSAARQGNYETAVEELEKLRSRFPFGRYAVQAQLDIIYTYFRVEEWDSAISAADRFIQLNPNHERVDYALYMRARANMNQGKDYFSQFFPTDRSMRDPLPLRQAFADLKRLVSDYPDSPYADISHELLLRLRDQLARHELQVARFYLGREAYVAAANRAKGLIENYQGTPAVREALEILAESYEKLGLADLREDVLRVIRLNYPNHPLVNKG